MTFSHEETQGRLLDLVYGEVEGFERAALEAHVGSCERCRRELAALGGTRAKVRAALVEEAAPSGVHARILRAAAEAVASSSEAPAIVVPPAAVAAPSAVVAPSPASRVPTGAPADPPSLWQRLRRGWALPTFATVGAFAVLLLASKVFLNPQRTYERGHEALIPRPSAPVAPPAENAPTEAPRAVEAAEQGTPRADEAAKTAPEAPSLSEDLRLRNVGVARRRAIGDALAKSLPHEHKVGAEVSGLGELGAGSLSGVLGARAAEGSASGIGRGGGALGGHAAPASPGAFASPPTGWRKGGAPAAAPASAPPAPVAAKRSADDVPEGLSASKADKAIVQEADGEETRLDRLKAEAPAPVAEKKKAAPQPAAKPAPAVSASVAQERAPAKATNASGSALKDTSDAKEREEGSAQEALAKRAEQLFAARRWSEALAAYRELLRRFPDADPAAKWRARVAQAQGEVASESARAAKKASAAEPAAASAPAEAR
jgi:hypothetical protein